MSPSDPIDRWPRFSGAAENSRSRFVLQLHLTADERTLGALNLYSAKVIPVPPGHLPGTPRSW